MPAIKNLPECIKIGRTWRIVPFNPVEAAWNWPKYEGKRATLYVVECAGYFKVGLTTNFKSRLNAINFGTPLPIRKVKTREVPAAGLAYAESWVHHQLSDTRVKGEWFAAPEADILALLPKAGILAARYEEECRRWYFDERRLMSDEDRAKAKAEVARLEAERNEATKSIEAALAA